MTLKVIGAGFGRTGTLTLKFALENLGFGPCYHMVEVFKNPRAPEWWLDAADGRPDWDKILEGYSATVDWPAAAFYAQLADRYPEAKVILTVRDAEAWFRSTQATIFPNATAPITDKPFDQMFERVIARLFDDRMRDHDNLVAVYNRHNAEVRELISANRLLVYEVARGWEPLCRFLDVPIPAAPMAHLNKSEDWGRHRSGSEA